MGWHDHGQSLNAAGPGTPHCNALIKDEGIQLDRHYVYVYCSPTRASFFTGRLPYHVNQINISPYLPGSGAARNMTMLPAKLKRAGYATHMIGSESPLSVFSATLVQALLSLISWD